MEGIRRSKRLIMGAFIAAIFALVVFMLLQSVLYKPDLRYERDSYSVFKDRAVTSCTVTNHGRRSAEKTRMSVEFLSRILDIRITPETAGSILKVTSDQRNAAINLNNIAPKDQVKIFFTVERSQDKPFDIYLFDISGSTYQKERVVPIR